MGISSLYSKLGYFKTYLNKVAELPEYKERRKYDHQVVVALYRLLGEHFKVEWFEKKQKLFKPQSSEKIKDIRDLF